MNHSNTHEGWRDKAACRHTEQRPFFPEVGDQARDVYAAARAICNACPVQEPCLRYAVDNRIEHGMWGGKSPRQRRALAHEPTPIRFKETA